jgi:hypothetical protein
MLFNLYIDLVSNQYFLNIKNIILGATPYIRCVICLLLLVHPWGADVSTHLFHCKN